jgi:hypothetical protein
MEEVLVGGMPRDLLLRRLDQAGIQFNEYARTLFAHPAFSPALPAEKVRLGKLSP